MTQSPVNNGLIFGAVLIICSFAMAAISPEKYVLYSSFLLFIVVIFFMIKIGRDARTLNDGILSFGEAFKAIFIGSAIAFTLCTAFEYVLNNFIFTDLAQIRYDATTGIFDSLSEMVPDATNDMEEAKDQISMDMMAITPMVALKNLFIRLIFPGAIVGLIAALITKREPAGV